MNEEGGFTIFAGTKPWYSLKEVPAKSQKNSIGKVRASAKAKRIVEFQEFDNMMLIEKDPFWRALFDEAATGKFPRKFKFQNGVLNYKSGSKIWEQALPQDAEMAAEMAKKFFFKGDIISPEDIRRKILEEEKITSLMSLNEVISWNQIRSEKQRMIMISLYVETIGKKYNLSMEERKGLVQNIRIGILAGYLNSENIEILGNCIENIHGLEYNKEKCEFEINREICPVPKITRKMNHEDLTSYQTDDVCSDDEMDESPNSSSSLNSSQSMKKRWNKFLSEISRK
jgi:hypothetical protein